MTRASAVDSSNFGSPTSAFASQNSIRLRPALRWGWRSRVYSDPEKLRAKRDTKAETTPTRPPFRRLPMSLIFGAQFLFVDLADRGQRQLRNEGHVLRDRDLRDDSTLHVRSDVEADVVLVDLSDGISSKDD